jgi:hypothetical protein
VRLHPASESSTVPLSTTSHFNTVPTVSSAPDDLNRRRIA